MKKNIESAVKSVSGSEFADGTYDFDTLKPVVFRKGYQVSFTQTGVKYTKREYSALCYRFALDSDNHIYIGKFDGKPETSFHFTNKRKALAMARMFNQISIWNWANMKQIKNPHYVKGFNN